MINKTLIENYVAAKYIVTIEDGSSCLVVDNHNKTLDKLLMKHNKSAAFFITPENPFSETLTVEENSLRHQRFVKYLKDTSLDYYLGYGCEEAETWPREKSYLILCDDEYLMHDLAFKFGQNAFLKHVCKQDTKLLLISKFSYRQLDT